MFEAALRLPMRRSGLVAWPGTEEGQYVLRNRLTGESFQIGAEEQFLLSRLDGRHRVEEICAAFAAEFSERLSPDALTEYIELAGSRGLLQEPDAAPAEEPAAMKLLELSVAGPVADRPPIGRRLAARMLNVGATFLEWAIWLPSAAHAWLQRRARRLEYVPRADDVFLVTYPRSGTTWMQMILYQLTTDGAMDFPHIAEFCPWFERSVRSAGAFEHRPSPRLFKSHLPWLQIPKGRGRYIYVARNGRDVAVSYYHLYCRYNGFEGTFEEFFPLFLKGKVAFGSWLKHIEGWWEHRHDENVLFLTYEELKRDLEACIRRIADFCGWDLSPETLQRAMERSRFDFMKQHEHRFDPALERLWEEGVQLQCFLRRGRSGDGALALSPGQQAQFERACADRLQRMGVAL